MGPRGSRQCDVAPQLATAGQHIALSYLFRAQRHGAGGGVVAPRGCGFARAAHPGAAGGVDRQGMGPSPPAACRRPARGISRSGRAARSVSPSVASACVVGVWNCSLWKRSAGTLSRRTAAPPVPCRRRGRRSSPCVRRYPAPPAAASFIDAAAEVAGLQIPLGHQRQWRSCGWAAHARH